MRFKKIAFTLPETNMFAPRNGGETNRNLRNSRGLFAGDMFVSGRVNSNEILLMEEIRRSPVAVGSLSHYRQGFFTSQLVQDFFHQQYVGFTTFMFASFS